MEIQIRLAENETKNDINALTLTNAICKFIQEHNSGFKNPQNFDEFIYMRDIADILQLLCCSADRHYRMLEQKGGVCEKYEE